MLSRKISVFDFAPEETARLLIERHALVDFISYWNSGDDFSSLISCFQDYVEAIQLSPIMREAICSVLDENSCPQLVEGAMQALLEPTIRITFHSGLRRFLDDWVATVIGNTSLRLRALTPFAGVEEWIDWCLQHAERPFLCSPQGGELFATEYEESLLRGVLSCRRETAVETGWATV